MKLRALWRVVRRYYLHKGTVAYRALMVDRRNLRQLRKDRAAARTSEGS